MSALLPVDEAIRRIVAGVVPLETERVPLAEAAGRTLAEPLAATRTQPPFPASAMDGYAVRAADTSGTATLRVSGIAAAGHRFEGSVGPGEAVRIFTGAPVPPGADAVLIQENAAPAGEDAIRATEPVAPGKNIRAAGFDFSAGEVLLGVGRRLGLREIAVAAAMNHARVPVRRRPRIALVATGDELVPPGAEPGPDQIVASNAVAIASLVRTAGGAAHDLGIVPDDAARIADAVEGALALPADILVTLGGASVGDHDLVQGALTAKGMTLDFWKIAMRPGKPLMFGRLPRDGIPPLAVLGVPGNPVSSLVCAILFLRPLIDALLGTPPSDPTEAAVLGADIGGNDARQDYVRATLSPRADGLPVASAFPFQDSSMLSVLARSDCLIVRPPHAPPGKAGDPCRIVRLP